MRRAIARGRMFPQFYSTDRRYGRLSLKAIGLFPLMWSNADDQGRLVGDPEEIKYAVCPNIDHITKADIPELLTELATNHLIMVYDTPWSAVIQILDWWEVNRKMQWAWPSDYPAPEGWRDRLRYKKSAAEVFKSDNWDAQVSAQVSNNHVSGERSGEHLTEAPLTTPSNNKQQLKTRTRRVRGNSPENSGEKPPSPSPRASPSESEILARLTDCFTKGWGRIKAEAPEKIIPRRALAKETAQLRDLARELSSVGGCPLDYIDQAFGEAAAQQKMHISYARAVLLDWLGIERVHPP